jgi:hypothetical protein
MLLEKAGASRPFFDFLATLAPQIVLFIFPSGKKALLLG